jgi:hypothetical protein
MNMKMSVVVLSVAALAAPGATSYAKDKGQGKGKGKGRVEQRSDDRSERADRRDRDDDRGDRDRRHDGDDKVTICHIPSGNRSNRHTITVGESAWEAHRSHGDHRGACGSSAPLPGSRFDRLDLNDDGVISLSEWPGDRGSFDRLDRNDDGVISRREYR